MKSRNRYSFIIDERNKGAAINPAPHKPSRKRTDMDAALRAARKVVRECDRYEKVGGTTELIARALLGLTLSPPKPKRKT